MTRWVLRPLPTAAVGLTRCGGQTYHTRTPGTEPDNYATDKENSAERFFSAPC